ncbi:hypothetical protein IWW56_000533 [Coemansia sp. RSA 2131]|nr:hypothetical protein IWW56_000533 [Coemansia sp. RSA 2131]
MSTLVETAFADDCTSGRGVEGVLYLIEQMLDRQTPLCECGIRSAVLVLQQVPVDVVQICSQNGDEASAFGLRIIDSCLSKLVDECDEAEKKLSAFIAASADDKSNTLNTVDSDATGVLHIALVCIEGLALYFEKALPGDDGMLKSPAIWKSVLEGTNALAVYLTRSFESSCKLFAHCTHATLRRQPQYAALSTSLCKAAGKVMDQISHVFSADSHIASDSGRKRLLLERYCNTALFAHKSIMSSPPQFKAVWKALCVIATMFSSAAFDSRAMCLKVYVQSCETVRTLAVQAVAVLRRTSADGLGDQKLQRRVKGILAFIRFIVFQMPSLLSKIQGSTDVGCNKKVVSVAMAMFDVLFGELSSSQLLVAMPKEISTMVDHLVTTVSTKFALSLFSVYPAPLLDYLTKLQRHTCRTDDSADAKQLPLLEGIRSPIANRELLCAVVTGISAFTEEQQQQLFTHAVPLVMAFSMAVDCDPASVFSITMGDSWAHSEQQSSVIEYERLVCSVALCATKLATPILFGHWETAALQSILQAPQGSLGTRMVVDAWGLLAIKALTPTAVTSTVAGILDVITFSPERISECGKFHLKQLFEQFFKVCSEDDIAQCTSRTCECVVEQHNMVNFELLCEVIPWHQFASETGVYRIGRSFLDSAISQLDLCDSIRERAAIFAGIAVLLPTYQLDNKAIANDEIWRHALTSFEKALQSTSGEVAEWQRGIESILQLAISLSEGGYSRSVELLHLCGQNMSHAMLCGDQTAFLVARLAGSFASTDLVPHTMEPTKRALRQIFGTLLKVNMPWIVRHQACVQFIRFATESVNQSITESLVPEQVQEQLLPFIQCIPGGESVETAELRTVYRQVLCSHAWRLPDTVQMNGSGCLEQLVGDIGALRQRLEAAFQKPMPARACEAIQTELARLVQTIERFPPS